jgi:phage terminase small subunit
MTEKQKRFCDEYVIDCNATQAAIRAGYSPKSAYAIGEQNLKKLELKNYIDGQLEKMQSEKVADAKEVLEYFTSVLRGEAVSEVVVVVGTGEGCSEPVTIEKHPDEREKLKAAEQLGKRYGLFTDRVDLNGSVSVVIGGEDELEE